MTGLAEIQRDLNETAEAIAHAERSLALHPDLPSTFARLQGFQKRRANLERQFHETTNLLGLDVCRYRIELDETRPSVQAVTSVLSAFQKLFTAVYAAITGPRQTTKFAADITEATDFGFAYTFPGSLGVAMTIQNDRLLLNQTRLDEAMAGVFEVMKARTVEDIRAVSERYGVATVRVAHQWTVDNAIANFGADITWQRKDDVRAALRVQPSEIRKLQSAINETTAEHDAKVIGELVMVDTEEKRFKMRIAGRPIEGRYSDAISIVHSAELPATYTAEMTVTRKIVATDDEEPVSYFLVRLSPA
jgi:hypothetical protein